MKDTLDSLVREAFPVEGQAPVEHLRFAARLKQPVSRKPARRAVVALCAVLLLTASAVTAKVVLGYQLLFENGRLVGSVSKQGKGVYILNFDKKRIPENGTPLNLEVRDESGKVVETMSIGRAVPQLSSNKKEPK
ncbi:hypothetical protein [Armatimonas rosea]|uniref:Uncharacterized protein n=1 Tax=Armatimonas rosea TaxID=685828 RepID=A0A7W9W7Q4_ARMRO|nr:hypothetical protein [Armatimonas rosea]MBB6051451.1 hypothetical protein [Armatimonas rosea]